MGFEIKRKDEHDPESKYLDSVLMYFNEITNLILKLSGKTQ